MNGAHIKEFSIHESLNNEELEHSLLVAMSRNPDIYYQVIDIISPYLMMDDNSAIYLKIQDAITNKTPMPELEGKPAENPITAAKELQELVQKKYIVQALQDGLKKALQENASFDECASYVESNINDARLFVKESRSNDLITVADSFDDLLLEICMIHEKRKANNGLVLGLKTGIVKLDHHLGGLQTGIHLISGEPGQGKTTFCLQAACNVSKTGYPVIFVSFEESIRKLTMNAICSRAGLEAKRYREGWGDPDTFKEASTKHLPELKNLYFIEGNSKFTIDKLKSRDHCIT